MVKIRKMLKFQSKFLKTDVTAITVYKNVTLIGIGATIHVYCNKSYDLINIIYINNTRGEHVFGIQPFIGNRILVFGEEHRTTYVDWILEAKLIDNDKRIVTVSMQNRVQIWDTNLKLIETFECEEQCILYSAHICYTKYQDLVILSGTVFNEVLVWRLAGEHISCVLKRLKKHEGVLFSIYYNEENGLICSTSDDRSAVLWKVDKLDLRLELNEKHPNIFPICQVYGHLSRIFRCFIFNHCFATAGEDSVINIWSLDGKLMQKVEANQNSPIWALAYDKTENVILSGAGNGGVYAFSLNFNYNEEKLCLSNDERPKLVGILASSNFVIFSEHGILYINVKGEWTKIKHFEDLKSYVLMKVSKCRKIVALAGIDGQIYIYKESETTLHCICNFQSKIISRIISLHWLACDMLLICQEGGRLQLLHLKSPSELLPVSTFLLPASSQNCPTTAVIFENSVIIGDRKGNILRYEISKTDNVQRIPKIHNHLGVTNLVINKNKLISLGRDSTIRTFLIKDSTLTLVTSDKVPYSWLLDVIGDLVIAFSGNNFIIWNYKRKRIVLEKNCGGGHRSWDFSKTDQLTFVYIKDKFINKIQYDLNANKSFDLVEPFHLNEINTGCVLKIKNGYLLISGGEDTTLRITFTNNDLNNFMNLLTLKSHLSSIRSIAVFKLTIDNNLENFLIFSAGGRAQIVCWTFSYSVKNNIVEDLICHENHSYYEVIDSKESETRIMDLCALELHKQIILFACCSDGYIKNFYVENKSVFRLKLCRSIFYKLRCIYKVLNIKVLNTDILVTFGSDGYMVFWDINQLLFDTDVRPFGSIPIHQSGINTVSRLQLKSDCFLFLTAGDDNAVVLTYLKFTVENGSQSVQLIDKYVNSSVHWAQITGSYLNDQYFLTVSVDQRLILYKWYIKDTRIICEVITKYNSSVADLKGLICFDTPEVDIFIYGLGVEFLKLVSK